MQACILNTTLERKLGDKVSWGIAVGKPSFLAAPSGIYEFAFREPEKSVKIVGQGVVAKLVRIEGGLRAKG